MFAWCVGFICVYLGKKSLLFKLLHLIRIRGYKSKYSLAMCSVCKMSVITWPLSHKKLSHATSQLLQSRLRQSSCSLHVNLDTNMEWNTFESHWGKPPVRKIYRNNGVTKVRYVHWNKRQTIPLSFSEMSLFIHLFFQSLITTLLVRKITIYNYSSNCTRVYWVVIRWIFSKVCTRVGN